MNLLDLDTPDATPDGNRLAPAPRGTTTTAARSTMVAAFRRMHAAIGVAESDGPAQSNWQVLAHRGFRWYFAGSVASNLGTWVQNTAQVVLAYELTHSVFWVGLVSLAQFSGPLMLGPWAGVMTHRFGSWRTLIVSQCASMIIAATLAALQFSQALTIARLFYGALAIGLAFTFALPALSVTVAALVPPDPVETRRATTRTLLLRDAGQGRQAAVMAAWAVAWAGSKPIASFTDGTLAGLIGVHAAGVLLALPALVPMLALVMFPGYVRRLGRPVVSG